MSATSPSCSASSCLTARSRTGVRRRPLRNLVELTSAAQSSDACPRSAELRLPTASPGWSGRDYGERLPAHIQRPTRRPLQSSCWRPKTCQDRGRAASQPLSRHGLAHRLSRSAPTQPSDLRGSAADLQRCPPLEPTAQRQPTTPSSGRLRLVRSSDAHDLGTGVYLPSRAAAAARSSS
jgi:hypothetical protein